MRQRLRAIAPIKNQIINKHEARARKHTLTQKKLCFSYEDAKTEDVSVRCYKYNTNTKRPLNLINHR